MKFKERVQAAKAEQQATVQTRPHGYITIQGESITVHRGQKGSIGDRFMKSSIRVIPLSGIQAVSVGGNDKKYMTGKRAAGVILTGGIGFLTPARVLGALVIQTTSGEVLEFSLRGKDAKRPEAIAMIFSARGVEVL
jgi:hypothetical protein